ncbi:MAG: SpoIID/LytB domain-containing protein [Planctomycetes bacterium]|nr:SpoIID/LytB domain-containing protein [Planctomycetota bacterium]
MIERILANITLNDARSVEMSNLIRREVRRLKLLCLAVLILVVLIGLLSATACTNTPPVDTGPDTAPKADPLLLEIPSLKAPPPVRVWLRSMSELSSLQVKGAGLLRDGDSTRELAKAWSGEVRAEGDALVLAPEASGAGQLRVKALSFGPASQHCSLNGNDFEGAIRIEAKSGKLSIINTVDIEAYCRGSVGWEAIPSWHSEALKAQAVAIRTYTLFTIYHNQASGVDRNWDVDDTTRFLRYGGLGPTGSPNLRKASEKVIRAVKDSAGEVMLHKGKIFKAFFASNSGGHSASVATGFGLAAIPPLRGVDLGDYGKASSLYRWKRTKQRTAIETLLDKAGQGVGHLSSITVETNDPSGFVQRVVLVGSLRSRTLSAADFRRILGTGPDGLPSTNFSVEFSGDEIDFHGRGWGHGVGMDQWASQGMAQAGMGYRDILGRHYPETNVLRPWTE